MTTYVKTVPWLSSLNLIMHLKKRVFCNISFCRFIYICGITVFEEICITYYTVNILDIVVLLKLEMFSNLCL